MQRFFKLIDKVQARTKGIPAREIRKVIRQAVEAARREKEPILHLKAHKGVRTVTPAQFLKILRSEERKRKQETNP